MPKNSGTSFELDVEDEAPAKAEPKQAPVVIPKPEQKSEAKKSVPLRKTPPKPKVHHVPKISKEKPKKESPPKEPDETVAPPETPQQPVPSLEVHPVKHTDHKVSSTHHEAIVSHPPKDNSDLLGIHVDPTVAAVVGTVAAVAATATAVTTGVATPAITAVKAGIIKAKAALGLSSKVAAVAGGTALAGVALVALERKFTDYEKDIQSTKKDVGDISEQIKKLDELIEKARSK